MTQDKYQLRELTADCFAGLSCPSIYEVAKVDCMVGGCPAVYEVAKSDCLMASCPAIFGTPENPDTYFIVGKIVDPVEAGLATKVGKDEQVVSIPKSLLDKLKR